MIQQLVPNPAGWGDPTWQTYTQAWGTLEPLRGGELLTAQQLGSEITGKSVTPYVSGVTPAMRFICAARFFQIVAVIDPEERHQELQILWKETRPT